MAFALFYFKADQTVEVGSVDLIKSEDLSKIDPAKPITQCPNLEDDDDCWINVKWTAAQGKIKRQEYFQAKVLLFSGKLNH